MDSGLKRKPIITNKDASVASIRRRLRRNGFSHVEIASYIRGWGLPVKTNKEKI